MNNVIDSIKNEFNFQIEEYSKLNLTDLINLITKSNSIYFTGIGKSQTAAYHSCDLLKSIGLKCYRLDTTNALHGDIGTINKNDLVIFFSNSGNTKELLPLINSLNLKECITYGICSNERSKFKKLCKYSLIIPFTKELECNDIKSIPTNSVMSQLLFSNILIMSLIDKFNIKNADYKLNHPAGNIGDSLKTVKECLILDYPKIIFNTSIKLIDVLLEMTKYKTGICIFVNDSGFIVGILLDGDIRRLLIKDKTIELLTVDNLNTDYVYETNLDKYLIQLNKHYKYIPVIQEQKVLGIVKLT